MVGGGEVDSEFLFVVAAGELIAVIELESATKDFK